MIRTLMILAASAAVLSISNLVRAEETVLMRNGDLTAHMEKGACAEELDVTVRSPSAAVFKGNRTELRKFLVAMQSIMKLQCPAAKLFRIAGEADSVYVFQGELDQRNGLGLVKKPLASTATAAPASESTSSPTTAPQTTTMQSVSGSKAAAPTVAKASPSKAAPAPSQTGFESYEAPTHLELFELFMAANIDLLNNDRFAYHHYLLFEDPSLDQSQTQRRCMDLNKEVDNNEIRRAAILADAQSFLETRKTHIASSPKTKRFRILLSRALGDYNAAENYFPFKEMFVREATLAGYFTEFRNAGFVKGCYMGNRTFPGVSYSGVTALPAGEDKIVRLPMTADKADEYLNRVGHQIHLEVIVEFGPIGVDNGAPSRIVEARALNYKTKQVLHSYDPALFEDHASDDKEIASEPAASTEQDPFIMATRGMMTLQVLRHHPELADGQGLIDAAAYQIRMEQKVWPEVDKIREQAKANPEYLKAQGFDWQRPVHVRDWQTLDAQGDSLAATLIQKSFVTSRPSWGYFDQAASLDQRFQYRVDALVFDRATIENREAEFVAREVAPVFKKHLLAAAKAAPNTLYADLILREPRYDYEKEVYTFGKGESVSLVNDIFGRVVYSDDPGADAENREATVYVPRSAERAVVLTNDDSLVKYDGDFERAGHERTQTARLKSITNSPAANSWRVAITRLRLGNGIFALDRQLKIDSVSVDRATAEARKGQRNQMLFARVKFEIDKIEFGARLRGNDLQKPPIFFATVTGVDVIDGQQRVLASFDPSSFVGREELDAQAQQDAAEAAKQEADAAEAQAAVDQQKAERRNQLRSADILGIRLGMTLQEAESVLREKMDVAWVAKLKDKVRGASNSARVSPNRPYKHFHAYVSADGRQQMVLHFQPDAGNKLFAIIRTVMLEENTPKEAVFDQLKQKYGSDVLEANPQWLWTVDFGVLPDRFYENGKLKAPNRMTPERAFKDGSCNAYVGNAWSALELVKIDGQETTSDENKLMPASLPVLDIRGAQSRSQDYPRTFSWDSDKWETCGPTVLAEMQGYRDNMILNVAIHDLNAYRDVYARHIEQTTTVGTVPDL